MGCRAKIWLRAGVQPQPGLNISNNFEEHRMKISRIIFGGPSSSALIVLLAGCGGDVKQFQAENQSLREEVSALRARGAEAETARQAELKRAQSDAQDVARLRGEVTQLRNTMKEMEKLRAENQQLRTENQNLRGANAAAANPPQPAAPAQPGVYPRESWAFAGYTSPEAALVSAIWSMQQGNAKQYFESLTAEEQARMAKSWENKSEAEIAAKFQNDVSKITGLRVLESQPVSADETVLRVQIDGVNREEKVSAKKVGNDWQFGGFIREPPKP
jgi:regulator of replication initiation timing